MLVPALQAGLESRIANRTSSSVLGEWSATHLVYDLVKVNGFVWTWTQFELQ